MLVPGAFNVQDDGMQYRPGPRSLAALLVAVRTYEIIWSWATDGLTRRTTTYIRHSYWVLALWSTAAADVGTRIIHSLLFYKIVSIKL
jgi:hypothetical protein